MFYGFLALVFGTLVAAYVSPWVGRLKAKHTQASFQQGGWRGYIDDAYGTPQGALATHWCFLIGCVLALAVRVFVAI